MSEETMGRHVERRTSDDGKQHWNLCLRDLRPWSCNLRGRLDGMPIQARHSGVSGMDSCHRSGVRDGELRLEYFPASRQAGRCDLSRFDVNPARLILIEQHDTSWPWWVVPMLGRHADRRYWVATAKDGKHRWDSEPADKRPWRSCSRGTWRKREFGYGKTESR